MHHGGYNNYQDSVSCGLLDLGKNSNKIFDKFDLFQED